MEERRTQKYDECFRLSKPFMVGDNKKIPVLFTETRYKGHQYPENDDQPDDKSWLILNHSGFWQTYHHCDQCHRQKENVHPVRERIVPGHPNQDYP